MANRRAIDSLVVGGRVNKGGAAGLATLQTIPAWVLDPVPEELQHVATVIAPLHPSPCLSLPSIRKNSLVVQIEHRSPFHIGIRRFVHFSNREVNRNLGAHRVEAVNGLRGEWIILRMFGARLHDDLQKGKRLPRGLRGSSGLRDLPIV